MTQQEVISKISQAQRIVVMQPENPDGDSLGSALALEGILQAQGKQVDLFCAIDMPKYLRYITGWDRVQKDLPASCDLIIIVDTASELLLEKALERPAIAARLRSAAVLIIDHHAEVASSLPFEHEYFAEEAAATGEMIARLAAAAGWQIDTEAATQLYISIVSDTLGLTTESVTAQTIRAVADLVDLGVKPQDVDRLRREMFKKSPRILAYKGELITRIEYHLEDRLATVHIPWEDIAKFSDEYNPNVLILEELRMTKGVDVGVAIKTYPDGKLTAKIRCSLPVAHLLAGHFGGGGHHYAAGFKIYEQYDTTMQELVTATAKILEEYDTTIQHADAQ